MKIVKSVFSLFLIGIVIFAALFVLGYASHASWHWFVVGWNVYSP